MKKTFLILMFLTAALQGTGQGSYQGNSFALGYNAWECNAKQPVDLKLANPGRFFFINDQARSYYIANEKITDEDTNEYRRIGWRATDERDGPCLVKENILKITDFILGK